jgi:hypothetical protein
MVNHSITSEEFDTLLRGFALAVPRANLSLDLSDVLLTKLRDYLGSENIPVDRTGLATDEELGETAARCLQELTDRGYKVSTFEEITPPTVGREGKSEFTVTVAKTFQADAPAK